MIYLDRSLAQAIVDRSMEIIDCNVNVMDAQGRIIASGDQTRIGTKHEGAQLVLAKQATVEIDDSLAGQLGGARPGVNLPLRAEGELVGCVGLTGEPERVRRYAELVRMAAETMIEQARLMQLLARDARLREELVLSLIRSEELPPTLNDWASRLGINLTLPRVAAIIEVDPGALGADDVLVELQHLHTLLTVPERHNLIATVSMNQLVVLKPALDAKGRFDTAALGARMRDLYGRMKASSSLGVRLALGQYFPGPGGLVRSFAVARSTMAIGKQRDPRGSIYFYADLKLPVLLDSLRQGWQAAELREPLRRLLRQDRQGQLVRTARCWFEHGMQMANTARALGIHRNTLDYRISRIEELCGVDLTCSDDCILLYLALQMLDGAEPAA